METDAVKAAADFADGSIGVLLIDDVDSGETVRQELEIWQPKLSPNALILLHGVSLKRPDSPRSAWANFVTERAAAYFDDGIGLSAATEAAAAKASPFRTALFDETRTLAEAYRLIAELIVMRIQTKEAERRARLFETRQTLFDTIVEDRTKAQSVIEHQERRLTDFNHKFDAINADRADAQQVMEHQFAQIQKMQIKMTDQKQMITVAKGACRNKGRCFVVPKERKQQRSIRERIAREFARIPVNLRRIFLAPPVPPQKKRAALNHIEKDYAEWIKKHEPTDDDLQKQQRESRAWGRRPKISLLIPLLDRLGAPGVVLVMTHRNAPRMKPMPLFMTSGRAAGGDDLPVMQDDRIHWNGQPIAVVLAGTQEEADHARSLIRATYEVEESATSFEEARAHARPSSFGGTPLTNERGDAEAALAAAPFSVDLDYRTPYQNHNAIEPHAATVAWDGDELIVHDATQGVAGRIERQRQVICHHLPGINGGPGQKIELLVFFRCRSTGRGDLIGRLIGLRPVKGCAAI
jgi:hypothetical protein